MTLGIISFLNDPAMRRALIGASLVSLSSAPLGVFLVLRRMSLIGDVIAHAILPGVAAAFIFYGMALPAMSLGGLIAGLTVALLAGLATRVTALREDASLAAFYLIAVALGVLLIALHGTAQDMEDILFGDASSLTDAALPVMAGVSFITLGVLALIRRPMIVESFDPVFLRSVGGKGGLVQSIFLMLAVLNMIESYRAMGTLMSAGLMLIPAITAQFWTQELGAMIGIAIGIGWVGVIAGLALAFAYHLPSGPAIILFVGFVYLLSLLFGRFGSVRARYFPFPHLER